MGQKENNEQKANTHTEIEKLGMGGLALEYGSCSKPKLSGFFFSYVTYSIQLRREPGYYTQLNKEVAFMFTI